MKSNRLLVVVIVLQALVLLGQWTGMPRVAPATAQIPDGGNQRQAMVDEQRATNAKLDKLIDLLQSGQVQVKVAAPEEKK